MSSFVSRGLAALFLIATTAACGGTEPPPANRRAAIPDAPAGPPKDVIQLPRRPGSVRFAAIGDAGRGHRPQYEVAAQMAAFREVFDFNFVVMLGDNVYDGGTPQDYRLKFELPYRPFLEDGVKFYAVLGNHDDSKQPLYPPFNMGGHRYYTFEPETPLIADLLRTRVQFFMLDTEALDPLQMQWLDEEMRRSDARWKIPIFHRPIYTSGRYGRPAQVFRGALEPIFRRHRVRAAFSGHEHFYERIEPPGGITYFISGAAGSLRPGDVRLSGSTVRAFDADYSFMLVEIAGRELFYQSISRTGHSVDHGRLEIAE